VSEEVGVGDCPKRADGLGHVWASWKVDPRKSCVHCGRPGRDNLRNGESGGYFAAATAQRRELIGSASYHPGRELTVEQKAKAAAIVEDKRRRDSEAVADGSARPGQVAGVKGQR
jgi:hypothetical protein